MRLAILIAFSALLAASCLLTGCSASRTLPGPVMTNSIGMKFTRVHLEEKELWVSVYETRVKDYDRFAGETGHEVLKPDFHQGGSHPVVNVSWHDALDFCRWLSSRERRRYRLPTDREWSAIAGIASLENPAVAPGRQPALAGMHPWGEGRITKGDGNYCDDAFGRAYDDGYQTKWLQGYEDGAGTTAPVGCYKPDKHGLYDLGGNAWEWCEDWYDPPANTLRVLRGGAWRTGLEERLLSSYRGPDPPSLRIDSAGFRVVMDAG